MFWKYVNILKSIFFRNFIRLKGIDIAVSIFFNIAIMDTY